MTRSSPPHAQAVVALITARGGSKSIPRKNLAPLAGRPLIAWSITAALQAAGLARVLVSTDDPEIAEVSRQWGAEAPFLRPAELAGDAAPHLGVMLHALDWLRADQGREPDYILLLQPTSPLRASADIEAALALGLERRAPAVVSVKEVDDHPYLMKRLEPDGSLADFIPRPETYLPRQALPRLFIPNGAIFLNHSKSLREEGVFFPKGTLPYLMPPERSLDIDTPFDLRLAELLLSGGPNR